jgi:hypothetical protein
MDLTKLKYLDFIKLLQSPEEIHRLFTIGNVFEGLQERNSPHCGIGRLNICANKKSLFCVLCDVGERNATVQ